MHHYDALVYFSIFCWIILPAIIGWGLLGQQGIFVGYGAAAIIFFILYLLYNSVLDWKTVIQVLLCSLAVWYILDFEQTWLGGLSAIGVSYLIFAIIFLLRAFKPQEP